MGAESKLALLIDSKFNSKGVDAAKKGLKGLDEAANKGAKRVTDVKGALVNMAAGAGAAGLALFAAKKAFDFGREGAQIARTREVFDQLTNSIGETSDAVLTKMRDATGAMVDNANLMQSASRLISMGLAKTGEEAAQLSEVAVTLGSAMGRGPVEAMEEFSLLLSNQSIPRLDTFGISASAVRTRIAELQAEIPGLTRETAFMQATMEQAEIAMDRLGGGIQPDVYANASAEFKNMTDELKVLAAEGLGPVVEAAAELLEGARKNREQTKQNKKTVKEYSDVQAELAEELGGTYEALKFTEPVFDKLSKRQETGRITAEEYADATEVLAIMLELLGDNADKTVDELMEMAIATRAAARAQEAADIRARGLNTQYAYLIENQQRLINTGDSWQRQVPFIADSMTAWERAADRVSVALMDSWQRTDDLIIKSGEIQVVGDNLSDAEIEAIRFRQAVDRAKNAILGISETSEAHKRAIVEVWLDANREASAYEQTLYRIDAAGDAAQAASGGDTSWGGPYGTANPTHWGDPSPEPEVPNEPTGWDVYGSDDFVPPGDEWPGGARGLDMVVPPGYPNDSYFVRASSRERVQITPAGETGGGGGVTYNITIDARGAAPGVEADIVNGLTMAGIKANKVRRMR